MYTKVQALSQFTCSVAKEEQIREFFSRKPILRSLYTEYLMHLITYRIDIDTMELFQNDSVNEQYEERLSDLVVIVQLKDSGYHILILLEHKSTRDPWCR